MSLYLEEGWSLADLKKRNAIRCPECGQQSVLKGWIEHFADDDPILASQAENGERPWWYCKNAICDFETEYQQNLEP